MKQIKVSELSGAGLDYCVAVCESQQVVDDDGFLQWPESFSSDWSQGGPIIEREGINLKKVGINTWRATQSDPCPFYYQRHGETPLIAAMRCYVASKLGDVVEIPEELL